MSALGHKRKCALHQAMSAKCHKRSFFKHLVGGMKDETNAVDQMSSLFEHLDSKNRWQVTGDLLPTLTFVEAREDRATVCTEIDSRWIAFVTSHRWRGRVVVVATCFNVGEAVAALPGRSAVLGSEDAGRRDSNPELFRVAWIRHDGVQL